MSVAAGSRDRAAANRGRRKSLRGPRFQAARPAVLEARGPWHPSIFATPVRTRQGFARSLRIRQFRVRTDSCRVALVVAARIGPDLDCAKSVDVVSDLSVPLKVAVCWVDLPADFAGIRQRMSVPAGRWRHRRGPHAGYARSARCCHWPSCLSEDGGLLGGWRPEAVECRGGRYGMCAAGRAGRGTVCGAR